MTYRNIDTSIWKDDWFLELSPDEKLLFIYLFSNEQTFLTGLYKISLRVIEFETALSREFIIQTLDKFARDKKVFYDQGVIFVTNLRKYNDSKSPKVITRIEWELRQIPDCPLKNAYLSSMSTLSGSQDTISIQYPYSSDTSSTLTIQTNTNQTNTSKPAAFAKFQNEIAMLTPRTNDMVGGWIDDYTDDWVCDAINEAVKQNVRKPAYIDAILKRWHNEGKSNGAKPYIPEDHASEVY